MNNLLKRWYPIALVVVGTGLSLIVIGRLPDPMAVHWDMDGHPNGYMPRVAGAFALPAMLLATWAILRVAPALDPRRQNYEKFTGAYDTAIAATLTLLFLTHLVVLALGVGYHVPVGRLAAMFIGALLLIVGNVVPRVRSNFMFGIRTPWTLSSDRVWARTHRIAGYTMTSAGLAIIVAGLLMPPAVLINIIVAVASAAVATPVVYSYFTWKRESRAAHPEGGDET